MKNGSIARAAAVVIATAILFGIVPMIGSLIEVVMRIMTPVIFSSVIGYASICVAGPAAWTGSMLLMIAVYYVKIRKLSKTKTVVAN